MELLRAHAEIYVRIVTHLSTSLAVFQDPNFWSREKDLVFLLAELVNLADACREGELPMTLIMVERIRISISRGMTEPMMREVLGGRAIIIELMDIRARLMDELETKLFFQLPYNRKKIFDAPLEGWEECVSRFPEIQSDVIEMSKCFALSRYAASVFHSTQVIEHALIHLLSFLENKDPKAGWTAACNALKRIVQDTKYADLKPYEQKHFAFLEQVHGITVSLNNTWRNKISHAATKLTLMTADFSPDVAEEITLGSRSFVRRLATELPTGKISD